MATKAELLKECEELGLDVKGKPTNPELEQLIKAAKAEVEASQEATEAPESVEEAPEVSEGLEIADDAKISVKGSQAEVYTQNGQYVRTYSKELHGPDFAELAKGFAKKKGFKVI